MEAPHVYIVHHNGYDVECYGVLEEDSNISVVCADECDDDVWCNANPVTGNPFETWEEAVQELSKHFESDIYEVSAC